MLRARFWPAAVPIAATVIGEASPAALSRWCGLPAYPLLHLLGFFWKISHMPLGWIGSTTAVQCGAPLLCWRDMYIAQIEQCWPVVPAR